MAIKVDENKFKCFFCGEKYKFEREADECVAKHNLIYVPMTPEEMMQLIRYIYDQQNPPIELIGRMKKIMKKNAGKTR